VALSVNSVSGGYFHTLLMENFKNILHFVGFMIYKKIVNAIEFQFLYKILALTKHLPSSRRWPIRSRSLMKKQDYWQFVRTQRAHGSKPTIREDGVISIHGEGLASYAYDYWKQNAVLPDDYMPIPEKEYAYNYLRDLWRLAKNEESFLPVVLDAYEVNYLSALRDSNGDKWYHIRRYEETGLFRSTVEAPQIRKILQKALRESKGIVLEEGEQTISGLMYLCLEYCDLKHAASQTEEWPRALFNNADILSLISEDTSSVKEIETVLETFIETRQALDTSRRSSRRSPLDVDKKSFDEDIRPILIGKLLKEAATFGAWQKVFAFSQDRDTKIFALYHMSDKAKSLGQIVTLYRSAVSIDLESLAHSFLGRWKDMCSKMEPEDIMKMPAELQLDHKFIEDLILQKCEG